MQVGDISYDDVIAEIIDKHHTKCPEEEQV